nr:hypothetical protein [Oryctes rhinoceros nudivirus]
MGFPNFIEVGFVRKTFDDVRFWMCMNVFFLDVYEYVWVYCMRDERAWFFRINILALWWGNVYKLGNGGQLLSVGYRPTFRKHGGTTLI